MSREIGSEFWDVPVTEETANFLPKETQYFLSGRSALSFILREIERNVELTKKTVALPSWCCDSMIKPFVDCGFKIDFYPVYIKEGFLVQDINGLDASVILAIDYFGYKSEVNFADYQGIVIRDLTHSVFSAKKNDADYYFGSLRKWCGFLTGGFAYFGSGQCKNVQDLPKNELFIALRKKGMAEKREYLSGVRTDKEYLKLFNDAEEYLDNLKEINCVASSDLNLIKKLDINFIREKRRRNAEYLLSRLKRLSEYVQPIFSNIAEDDCPLFVPVIVKHGRDILRKKLIQEEIYCPVHWGLSKYHNIDSKNRYIYEHELSIVCDQRYNEDDMERIYNAIRGIYKC